MLSRSYESKADQDIGTMCESSRNDTVAPEVSLQDDVERLLDVAGQLFLAIEDHIRRLEDELVRESEQEVQGPARTLFKERLIQCAESRDTSIRDVGHHLDRRANEHIENYRLRDFA